MVQRDRKILEVRLLRDIAVNRLDLLPEEPRKAGAPDELQAFVASLSQISEKRLDHRIEVTIRARTHGQHLAADIVGRLRRLLLLESLQAVDPLLRAEEVGMLAHRCFVLGRDAELHQPDRRLVGLEDRRRQLQIEQPIVGQRRLRPVLVNEEACRRLSPQHPVFQAELVVGDLDLSHAVKRDHLEHFSQLPSGVVPEDDAMTFVLKQTLEPGRDAVIHQRSPAL